MTGFWSDIVEKQSFQNERVKTVTPTATWDRVVSPEREILTCRYKWKLTEPFREMK